MEPYTTKHREFYFYFPSPGNFTHYQTRVSKNGKVIGFGKEDPNVVVVDPEDVLDTTSWEYFSRKASNSELLEHLQASSDVHKVDLNKITWRMEGKQLKNLGFLFLLFSFYKTKKVFLKFPTQNLLKITGKSPHAFFFLTT